MYSCSGLHLSSHPFGWPKQAREMGGRPQRRKGTQIVFKNQLNGKWARARSRTSTGQATAFVLTNCTLFNVEQCDGLTVPEKLPATQQDDLGIGSICEAL